MKGNWWRSQSELDPRQKQIILTPVNESFAIKGPPGSGKTNLLLLRAQFTVGSGHKNILFITYTNALCDFLRSGIVPPNPIKSNQIKTFHSWANDYTKEYLGESFVAGSTEFSEETRKNFADKIELASQKHGLSKIYDAIFVDEAQDFTQNELNGLLSLSDRICICGDDRQGIYQKDGLNIVSNLGLKVHSLISHYRIGPEIAKIADRLLPPANGESSLLSAANYNTETQGQSTAELLECTSRDVQLSSMLSKIEIQLDAYPEESIGIFCGKRATVEMLQNELSNTKIKDLFQVHGKGATDVFTAGKPINILTIHSSKGAEFRAVHIFGAEELAKYPLNRTTLIYTAVTRAKTSLTIYYTGSITPKLESAFTEKSEPSLGSLFAGD